MAESKAKSQQKAGLLPADWKHLAGLFHGWGRGIPLGLLTLAAFSGLWCFAWRHVGPQLLLSSRYWLTQDKVEITPPPEWVQGDIRAEAFPYAMLDGPVSITSDDLVARIASAFSLHPWVARVHRVEKHYPARATVELDYRRPVCLVEVCTGLLPVDHEGVVLPELAPSELRHYPRLEAVDTIPIGPEGTRWKDARVLGGAKLAAALGPAWQELHLDRIVPSRADPAGPSDQYTYELVTRAGTRILWGQPPGQEAPEETPATEKLAWILTYQKENGSLAGMHGPQQLDLRRLRPRPGGSQVAGP